jgi:hypothetical protein
MALTGVLRRMGQPPPFGQALGDAVNTASTAPQPGHGLAARPRSWPAWCLTASLVPTAVGGARCERASLGPYARAALAGMCRHAHMPWALLRGARGRGRRRHGGITHGRLVVDGRDQPRAQSAKTIASRHDRRDTERAGGLLGQRPVLRLLATPKITLPVGLACDRPAPELTAGSPQARTLQPRGSPRKRRPRQPPSQPH